MKKKDSKYLEYTGFILTELLPFEIPILFSFEGYYQYLIDNNRNVSKELDLKKINKGMEFNRTLPLSFRSFVRTDRNREISIISPYSYIDILKYVKKYEKNYLYKIGNSPYSIRKQVHKKGEYTEKSKKEYSIDVINMKDVYRGSYYNLRGYKRLYEFENSKQFFNIQMNNKYFLKLDIKSCFSSIYTHSYKWIITNDFNESRTFGESNHLFAKTDKLLQKINNGRTNGILVGPEFMRLTAELLLSSIDAIIQKKMEKKFINPPYIARYIDDYFIFSNEKDIINDTYNIISETLEFFQLNINDRKVERHEDYFLINKWYVELSNYYLTFDISYYDKKNFLKLMNIIEDYKGKRDTVISYICSTMSKNIHDRLKQLKEIDRTFEINSDSSKFEVVNQINKTLKIKKWKNEPYEIKYCGCMDGNDFNFEQFISNHKLTVKEEWKIRSNEIYNLISDYMRFLLISPKYINILKLVSLIIELLIYGYQNCFEEVRITILNAISNTFEPECLVSIDTKFFDSEIYNLLLAFELIEYKLSKKVFDNLCEKYKNNPLMLGCLYRYAKHTLKLNNVGLKKIFDEEQFSNNNITSKNRKGYEKNIWYLIIFAQLIVQESTERDNLFDKYLDTITENNNIPPFNFDKINVENIEELSLIGKKIKHKTMSDINY